MKIIENKWIPFRGFSAVNMFGVLFVRKGAKVTDTMLRHEEIHTMQMMETAYVGFYLWYAIEGSLKCFAHGKKGYYRIGFEQEAYLNEHIRKYKNVRTPFEWLKYVNKIVYFKGM